MIHVRLKDWGQLSREVTSALLDGIAARSLNFNDAQAEIID